MTQKQSLLPVIDQPDVGIVMPDGCRLSARIWMPEDADTNPVPAIIEHLPYRKRDGTIYRDELGHPYIAARGYACIRVDMRGNGDSQGLMQDEYSLQELEDACSVIHWASNQAWCSGNVGMMGISWGGFNSLQVAAMKPPALKAIITVCSSVDRFADDIHYKGGCLLTENIGWAATMLSYSSRPPDPALVGESWLSMWMDRLHNLPYLASTWLRHQSRDSYWQHGSVCEDYTAIDAAVLSVGGWHDGYRNTINHLVANLSAPVKGIVGPWIHKYPHYAAPEPAIGFLQESLRWWDRWLKDIDTGVESDPDYRVWLMDSIAPKRWLPKRPGKWIGEQKWPSDSISDYPLYIRHENNITELSASVATCDLSISSIQSCGQNSGEYFPFTYGPELPDNQIEDDACSACADTVALEDTLEIVGAPVVELMLASDKPQAIVVARLCDVRPDGSSALITSGMLNLVHRNSFEQPAALVPGQEYKITFPLDQIAYSLPVGHRLRLALSTTYWPFIWPSPEAARLHISSAKVTLPVKTHYDDNQVSFERAETSSPWQAETLRATSSTRDIATDAQSGEIVTVIQNDFGEFRDKHHQLISGGKVTEIWSIKDSDPLAAKGVIQWQQTGGRGAWHWQSDVDVEIRCDREFFYTTALLRVYNDGELIFDRNYSDKVERIWV